MRILIDIGHPAHVHYFRNFINIMKQRGHQFLIIAKDKNVTHELLAYYNIPFIKRREYPRSIWGKLVQIPFTDLFVLSKALSFKPDILMGFSGTHIAHVGWLMRRPSVVLDNTEHAKLAHASYKPFAKHIVTPSCFLKDMGKKHIKFNSYMELCALHPKYFIPDSSIKKLLCIDNEEYIVLRFVSWSASHDIGQNGLTLEAKRAIVKKYIDRCRIFISSEGEMPFDLEKYRLNVPAHRLHDVLSFAKLYIGEGSTTASECSVLGVPAIYVNSLIVGYCKEEEEKYGLCYRRLSLKDILNTADNILECNKNNEYKDRQKKILKDKIDPTAFLVWFIEKYPESVTFMKNDSNIQYGIK